MSEHPSTSDLEALVRRKLAEVAGVDERVAINEDLLFAGVGSLDLVVVLSTIEADLKVSLAEAFSADGADSFMAKGFTIGSIVSSIQRSLVGQGGG